MGYLKIKCDYCGGSWEVYHGQLTDELSNSCPHCNQEIDRQTWEKFVIPAYGSCEDMNMELLKDHTGYKKPIFEVSFMGDTLFRNRKHKRKRGDE